MQKAVSIESKIYVINPQISEESIAKRNDKKQASRIMIGSGYLLSIMFFITSIVFVVLKEDLVGVATLKFWLAPSFGVLCFSISLLFGAFIFQHKYKEAKKKKRIPGYSEDFSNPSIEELQTTKDAINIVDFFDENSTGALDAAFELAKKFGHQEIEPIHIFIGTFDDSNIGAVLSRLSISIDAIKDPIGRRLSSRQIGPETQLSEESKSILLRSFINAYKQKRGVINALEFFYEAFKSDEFIQELFFDQGITKDQFANMIEWVRIHEKMRERYTDFRKAAAFKPTGPMNRSMTSVATPLLDAFSEDLTTMGVNGRLPLMVGREKEVKQIFRIIEGGRQSAVLVGSDGVGKKTILHGIAQLMVEENVPEVLKDKRLVRLSVPHLLSGVDPSMAQERLLRALNEVAKSGNIILAVTDIEQMAGMSDGTVNLATSFVDFLSRSGTFAIATTNPRAYANQVERSVLSRIFQKVDIQEPETNLSIHILESKIGGIEYEQGVTFSYKAVESAVSLTDRYMHEDYLPKKAIDVAREAAQFVKNTKGESSLITDQDVAQIISEKTNIPLTSLKEEEKYKLLNLEDKMHERVIGQSEAVSAVASALRRARTNLQSKNRPIATFLFMGPTGVGKTELTKTIASVYFGDDDAMVRLDMSEFQEVSSIQRLIGMMGSTEGGLLTEAVRQNPFTIVLLDEFEKASPQIMNLFLQVFDDGRLTDNSGRIIDFTNTILVATSNAGSEYIQEAVKRNEDISLIRTTLIEEKLKTIYSPEMLNRFDGVIVFKPLSQEDVVKITGLMIEQVKQRLLDKGIEFDISEEMIQSLAKEGYDPKFGARPLRRVIQEKVDNSLAKVLLEEDVKRRDKIIIDINGTRIERATEI